MSNASKKKGTTFENDIVECLKRHGWPLAERRALAGGLDRGDISGVPGVVIEAKNCRTMALAMWLEEARREAVHDKADFSVVWHKRRGKAKAEEAYVTMDGATFMLLLTAAEYGGNPQQTWRPQG